MWRMMYPLAALRRTLLKEWREAKHQADRRPWEKRCRRAGLPNNIRSRSLLASGHIVER